MANVCAHLSTHKGTNNRDRRHYLPDERADDRVDRVVDDVVAPVNRFMRSRLV